MKRLLYILFVALFMYNGVNAQKLTLQFNNLFKGHPIVMGQAYQTPLGDSVSFSTLNYFISNIVLVKKDGSVYKVPQDSSYFLLKQSENTIQQIELNNIPEGKYKELQFTIGVDSLRNTMDVSKRTGDLDVGGRARGMYWVWNSGYIFFKLEGKSIHEIDSLRKNFRYHIGGYGGYETKTINNIKIKQFNLNKMLVKNNRYPKIHINVAIDQFFNSITPIKILEHSSVMWGDFSVKIANNYEQIFTLSNITYE